MSETLIKVEGVSKKFCKDLKRSLWYGVKDIGSSLMGAAPDQDLRKGEFWAVKDVSFEVKRGECLGLIGHNGAGKSTLLKMLNGLIRPDKGRIEMRGKIGALIELGAGFNPVLTGRENVYNNGAVLGFSKAEIDRKFDEIVAFAELEEFIDMPVQNYSSGMKVRLGFAVASQMEPDILLVDEVLAVGDVGFRMKCYNEIFKMMDRAAVIFVSHSMPQVGKVSTRGILMKAGKVLLADTNISRVIARYNSQFDSEKITFEGSGRAQINAIKIEQNEKTYLFQDFSPTTEYEIEKIEPNQPLNIIIDYLLDAEVNGHFVLISFTDADQKLVLQLHPNEVPFENIMNNYVTIELPELQLNTGKYAMAIHILGQSDADWGETLIGVRGAIKFGIEQRKFLGSAPYLLNPKWSSASLNLS